MENTNGMNHEILALL